ncbi:MAG: class II aldolase/adducin family protein [Actinomycetia bacterium]|nr:class II aldolase/adducin family protein [Actinomycetes bacterium]
MFAASPDRLTRFAEIGRDLFVSGQITSHGGNLSEREGKTIYITRTGSQLGRLRAGDVVEAPLAGPSEADASASSELVVHRAIYQALPEVGGVCHAHSMSAVLCAMLGDTVSPLDSEARLLMGEVPVLESPRTVGSELVAELMSKALATVPVAILRGHGPFAAGKTLEDAYRWVSVLEYSCKLILQARALEAAGATLIDYPHSATS